MKNQVFWDHGNGGVFLISREDAVERKDYGLKGFVVSCAKCRQPAAQLDNLYPYHQENCLCAEHSTEIIERNETITKLD